MSVAMTRWKIQLRRSAMAEQLAQSRRSRRETRHLLSNPANAAQQRDGIQQLNHHPENVIVVEFGKHGHLIRKAP